jgi:hypothetical protein
MEFPRPFYGTDRVRRVPRSVELFSPRCCSESGRNRLIGYYIQVRPSNCPTLGRDDQVSGRIKGGPIFLDGSARVEGSGGYETETLLVCSFVTKRSRRGDDRLISAWEERGVCLGSSQRKPKGWFRKTRVDFRSDETVRLVVL